MTGIKQLDRYIESNTLNNLHLEAFTETYNKIEGFIYQSETIYSEKGNKQYIRQVVNSAPGSGKTTALKAFLKRMGKERFSTVYRKRSFLLVFNTVKNMMCVYDEINGFAIKHSIPNLIQYVDADNVESVIDTLADYQIICITQHRFRDLALGYGDWRNYNMYIQLEQKIFSKRSIIIDEMPLFFNEQIFDLAEENNTIQFYDTLTDNTPNLNEEDIIYCRNLMMELIATELKTNEQSTTRRLLNPYVNKEDSKRLSKILKELNTENIDTGTLRRFDWFLKLLKYDDIGCIERHRNKNVILCSEFIDYSKMGNILVLDGSSHITKIFYDHAGFQIQEVNNYHNYKKRLKLIWGKINTTYDSRKHKDKGVQQAIAYDIQEYRNKGKVNILPLMNMSDKAEYIKNGTITEEQLYLFVENYIEDNMAINLLNTTGINDLVGYNSLALLNLPIRRPSYYRLKLIGIMTPTLANISINKESKDKWFEDDMLNKIFESLMLADFYQIIHRSNLRNINDTKNTYILLYHSREEWTEELRKLFKLLKTSVKVKYIKNGSKNGFNESCTKWAIKVKETLDKHKKDTVLSPYKVANAFNKFISTHWKDPSKRTIIQNILSEHGIRIYNDKNKSVKISLLKQGK